MRVQIPRLFGIVWLIDASLKLTPAFHQNFVPLLAAAGDGRPGWSHWWFQLWFHLGQQHPSLWIGAITVVEFCLAAALLAGVAPRTTYVLGASWSLGVWLVPEGFGYDMMRSGTDIGTSIMYVVVFLTLLAYAVPGQVGVARRLRIIPLDRSIQRPSGSVVRAVNTTRTYQGPEGKPAAQSGS